MRDLELFRLWISLYTENIIEGVYSGYNIPLHNTDRVVFSHVSQRRDRPFWEIVIISVLRIYF